MSYNKRRQDTIKPHAEYLASIHSRVTEDNGQTFSYYTYDYAASTKEMGSSIVTYGEALKDMGYTVKKISTSEDNEMYHQTYKKDGYTAELAVFAANTNNASGQDDIVKWRVVLAVPEGINFFQGNGAPHVKGGKTECKACRGSGKCEGCGGNGRANYGNGSETCVICDGERICRVCDGEGYY
ncbi:MAG: hypothetical protein ACI38A_06370 [Candidatus Ornithomonoglobus sp.]